MRLLVLNPNSSEDMTRGMEKAIRSMHLPDALELTMYTAPPNSGSPPSINDAADIQASTKAVWAHLNSNDSNNDNNDNNNSLLKQYNGVLVACYSAHTLVDTIVAHHPDILVTGIFEASIAATLPLLRRANSNSGGGGRGGGGGGGGGGGWGIVTTGQFWEAHLTSAVKDFLVGQSDDDAASANNNKWFRGVFTTGLNAGDFHGEDVSPATVREKLSHATRRLLRTGGVDCVIMGCAGMAGLEEIIREACVEEYGEERARGVFVVDPVRAGVGVLEGMVRNRGMFLP